MIVTLDIKSIKQVHHSLDPELPDESYKLPDFQKQTSLAIIFPEIARHVTISAKFLT